MTTASTWTFQETRDEIIRDALSKVGATGPDVSPSGPQLLHAARALNRVVKSLDPEGEFLWRVAERTATTTSGTGTITPLTDVISVDEPMNYMRSGSTSRSPIRAISRDDWMSVTDRTTTGTPSQFYVSRVLGQLTINLWPVPDATGDTVTYSAVLRSFNFDTGSNTPDFDSAWTACLVYGLAADLGFDYGQAELSAQLRQIFNEEKMRLLNEGTETGNATLVPWGASGGGWT